jgi:hypothetical protein
MTRVLRAFFIWAIALALPIQGAAAALALCCDHTHRATSLGDPAASAQLPCRHAHEHGHAHSQAEQAQGTPKGALSAAPDTHIPDDFHHHGTAPSDTHIESGCSSCAACCSVLAMPMSLAPAAHTEPGRLASWSPPVKLPLNAPDTPERPPRALAR